MHTVRLLLNFFRDWWIRNRYVDNFLSSFLLRWNGAVLDTKSIVLSVKKIQNHKYIVEKKTQQIFINTAVKYLF